MDANPQFQVGPYPMDRATLDDEIKELADLAKKRDDLNAIASDNPARPRKPLSDFVQLRPTAVRNNLQYLR